MVAFSINHKCKRTLATYGPFRYYREEFIRETTIVIAGTTSPEEEEEEEEEPEFSLVNNVTFNGMPRHNGMFSLFRHSDKWGKDSMYPTLIRAAVLDLDDPMEVVLASVKGTSCI
ncbi:hypothetical protein M514_03283 [Trichuris suis]|uniref:Uncharacterized protein n=1 Tax=Trichuris suis TaxID=68888 RepID=A0A085NL49_9BILA|nr:hypothetical protein M514_03283 [Trichuris suis]